MDVKQILEIDFKYREEKVEDDLYTLDQLDKNTSWDFSYPTLIKKDNIFLKQRLSNLTTDSFINRFYKSCPVLKHPDFDWNNILIAGGSVGDVIYDKSPSDIDIFLYGLDEKEAVIKIESICRAFIKHLSDKKNTNNTKKRIYNEDELDINYTRTKNTLTINSKYQIIFRLYNTKSEILHGFDLGSSAVGFDGQNVLFTSLSKFCYQTGCNIIDTTRRSTTYEYRLRKYFNRGFDIIFPYIDVNKLKTNLWDEYSLPEVCELPYFIFTYKGRQGNKIPISKFYFKTVQTSDYDKEEWTDEYVRFHTNINKLLSRDFDSIIYSSDSYYNIIHNPSCITFDKVHYLYDNLESKITSSHLFPTRAVEKYITVEDVSNVFTHKKNKMTIRNIITNQKNNIRQLIEELKIHDKRIPFLTENPGTQLTSSFNPIMENPQEWYGSYYLQN